MAGWYPSGTLPKLAVCSADPWSATESGTAVMWLNMALSSVRRMWDRDRTDIELWLRSKIANKALAELLASAERMLPLAPYDDVLIYVRDRITGVLEREDRGRWMEAALAVHQRPDEGLTAFLTRLETAVNELTVNLPEQATTDLIYFIYRGSLSERTRDVLEKNHLYTNRARDLQMEERLRFLHSCLYKERLREQQSETKTPKNVVGAASSPPRPSGSPTDFSCRTCETNEHSYRDCEVVKKRLRCHRCGDRGHLRKDCPLKAGTTTSQTTTPPMAPTSAPSASSA